MNLCIEDDSKPFFSDFILEEKNNWQNYTIVQKEYQVHQFLNIECGAGVFTFPITKKDILITCTYDNESRFIILDTQCDLDIIDERLENFLKQLI